jgi:hypothetical protein
MAHSGQSKAAGRKKEGGTFPGNIILSLCAGLFSNVPTGQKDDSEGDEPQI